MSVRAAIAIGAHPDDIEFRMAGTLVLLRVAGYETHYMNLASGSCGSLEMGPVATRALRRHEARNAARILGARFHPSIADDLEIAYNLPQLRRLAAVIRDVQPSIILTHSLEDYMEDHTVTARLAVTAAFARGMPNFVTCPRRPAYSDDVTVYHAMPHGLRDAMGRRVTPECLVDVATVQAKKREALLAHRSQQRWLDASQGMNSFVRTMENMDRAVAKFTRGFRVAEGWRRHNHLGFCEPGADPLATALSSKCRQNPAYRRRLDAPVKDFHQR